MPPTRTTRLVIDLNTVNCCGGDALFEAGCSDALLAYYNNSVFLEFNRQAPSYEQAVMSAIRDIESAKIGAIIVSRDAGEYVVITDIAELSSLSKQVISNYNKGIRGRGEFPCPVQRIQSKTPLWKWSQVAEWLLEEGKGVDAELVNNALITESINMALSLRQQEMQSRVQQFSQELAMM